jgi:enoyl-CoA hydratase
VSVVVDDRVGLWRITLDRPPVNAIDFEVVRELVACFERARDDRSCRAVVLTGAGYSFSAGMDVKALPLYDERTLRRLGLSVNRLLLRLYGLAKPVVAAINGDALGWGLVLAMACDFRVAVDGVARLGISEIAAGAPFPFGPLAVLRAELDARTLRRLTLGAEILDVAAAGVLLDSVVPAGELLESATQRAEQAAAMPSFGALKRQIRRTTLDDIGEVLRQETDPVFKAWLDDSQVVAPGG